MGKVKSKKFKVEGGKVEAREMQTACFQGILMLSVGPAVLSRPLTFIILLTYGRLCFINH